MLLSPMVLLEVVTADWLYPFICVPNCDDPSCDGAGVGVGHTHWLP